MRSMPAILRPMNIEPASTCMGRVVRRLYGGIYGGMLAVCTVERGWPGGSGVWFDSSQSMGLLVLYCLSARVKTVGSGVGDFAEAMGLVCI